MDRQHVRYNLERIVRLAESYHLPADREQIADLGRNALHAMERQDLANSRAALTLATLAKATRIKNGRVDYEDMKLLDWAIQQAHDLFPPEPTPA